MDFQVTEELQAFLDKKYPEGITDLEATRFYANLAVRALFYGKAQGVVNSEVLDHLMRQAFQAERKAATDDVIAESGIEEDTEA